MYIRNPGQEARRIYRSERIGCWEMLVATKEEGVAALAADADLGRQEAVAMALEAAVSPELPASHGSQVYGRVPPAGGTRLQSLPGGVVVDSLDGPQCPAVAAGHQGLRGTDGMMDPGTRHLKLWGDPSSRQEVCQCRQDAQAPVQAVQTG